jgi:hypothetical protein
MKLYMSNLLTRPQFKEAVFKRDGFKCVLCNEIEHLDAHHILERKLFDDGGYYLDNGVTLCAKHHLMAETTELTCDQLRMSAGIKNIILPDILSDGSSYDKWGNAYLGKYRTKGPLFDNPEVQKIIQPFLSDFIDYVKYPRTFHLPWSSGLQNDDKRMDDINCFNGKKVVATIKLDGENASMYSDYYHARSLDSRHHPSRNWIKSFHATIKNDIPKGWRFCGENLYAQHSVAYDELESYFYLFSIWNEKNECLSWEETKEWAQLLNICVVPEIYIGNWDIEKIKSIEIDTLKQEGYVVRNVNKFHYSEFNKNVAKYVRAKHVQTSDHWMSQKIVTNGLKKCL